MATYTPTITKYEALLFQSMRREKSSELIYLEKKIQQGIYEGGIISQLRGKAYDDNDLARREELYTKIEEQSLHTILLLKKDNGLPEWNWRYELNIAKVIEDNDEVDIKGKVSFTSERTAEELMEAYMQKFKGTKTSTRMGPIAIYPSEELQFQMVAMVNEWAK